MSHDSVSRSVFGVTHATIVRRILATFDRASASDIESGATWYDAAGDLATELSGEYGRNHAAVVIAHMSPRTTWTRNVLGARALLVDGVKYPAIMGDLYDRAVRSLDFEDPFESFGPSAPKTLNFARNISGDREAVTVDVWAARVANLDDTLLGRKGAYDAVAHAYRLAAHRRGVDPATMQATTWIVARNGRSA